MDRREFEGSIQEQVAAAFQYVLEKINLGMKYKVSTGRMYMNFPQIVCES